MEKKDGVTGEPSKSGIEAKPDANDKQENESTGLKVPEDIKDEESNVEPNDESKDESKAEPKDESKVDSKVDSKAEESKVEGSKDLKSAEDSKDSKDSKDAKNSKDSKDAKDPKDSKELKSSKDSKDSKISKASKDSKETKNSKANSGSDVKPLETPGENKAPLNPEMEAYMKLRRNLKDLIAKKIKLDQVLEETEDRLYVEEGAYLQEASAGNIAKGFEQYTKSSQNRRKSILVEQDRVFSQSSTSFDAEM